MGMQNMQVQQPMQQSQGKGAGAGLGQGAQMPVGGGIRSNTPSDAELYFQQNPDVARSFSENNYGMSMGDFAQSHYQKYGQAENRAWPSASGGNVTYAGQTAQPRMGRPNQYVNTVGRWDNATIAPQSSAGKGGKTQSNYPVIQTNYSQPTGKSSSQTSNPTTPVANSTTNQNDFAGY